MNSDNWCVKCAKYLAFGTFERADDSALRLNKATVMAMLYDHLRSQNFHSEFHRMTLIC